MTYLQEVIAQARGWDDARARSQQTAIGWSGIFGCRSWIGFTLAQQWATEDVDTWRAIAGTALHEWLQGVRNAAAQRDHILTFELPVEYQGIPGHVDEVNYTTGEITDYKFPSLKSARLWDDPDVQNERFIQPQGYAAAIVGSPQWRSLAPDPDHATVRILCAPVDGTFADWKTYERPFDRAAADAAAEKYWETKRLAEAGEPLPKDKPVYFCSKYCAFFTACRGGDKEPDGLPEITDPLLAAAVEQYGRASEQISAGYKVRDQLRPILLGLRGRARGYKVFMSRNRGMGKWEIDEDEVRRIFSANGLEVPMRQASGKPPALYVVRDK